MITVTDRNLLYKTVNYFCSEQSDIEKLPTEGIGFGSLAELLTADGTYSIYKYRPTGAKNSEGKLIGEWKNIG